VTAFYVHSYVTQEHFWPVRLLGDGIVVDEGGGDIPGPDEHNEVVDLLSCRNVSWRLDARTR
jgi:hypothetical protein